MITRRIIITVSKCNGIAPRSLFTKTKNRKTALARMEVLTLIYLADQQGKIKKTSCIERAGLFSLNHPADYHARKTVHNMLRYSDYREKFMSLLDKLNIEMQNFEPERRAA